MSKLHALGLVVCVSVGAIGCHQEDVVVRTASGEQSTVGRYSTFTVVVPNPEDLIENDIKPETLQTIASYAVEELQSRGYTPVAAEQADLFVAFGPRLTVYGVTRAEDVNENNKDSSRFDETTHAQGTLTVSFIDAKAKAVVLQRVAETRLLIGGPSEDKMRKGIAQVFEGIPHATAAAAPAPAAPAPEAAPAAAPASAAPAQA